MTLLAHKEQAVVGTILFAGEATAWAALARVVRINTYAATACQGGFVGERPTQLGKRPLRGMAIGLARFGGHRDEVLALAALFPAPGPFADASQVFQTNQTVRMGLQNVLGNRVVRAQLKPSRLPGRGRYVAAWRSRVPLRWSRCWTRA